MKIRLLRGSHVVKEVEFPASLLPLEIHRLSVDLMFEHFERNATHIWPLEEDSSGSRHQIRVISDQGNVLKTFDVREMAKEFGLGFLARKVDGGATK